MGREAAIMVMSINNCYKVAPMTKHRFLIVHSQLVQHGSERLLYEIAKLLRSDGYVVDVLTRPFGASRQYYYTKLIQLGVGVIPRLVTFRHATYLFKWIRSSKGKPAMALRWLYGLLGRFTYFNLANDYGRVLVIGMETYCDSFRFMNGDKSNFFVHHVMHAFQQDRDYCDEYDLVKIIVHDARQREELSARLPKVRQISFPLLFDLGESSTTQINRNFKNVGCDCRKLRIGVVSRLQLDRPNEPIFRHFASLAVHISSELHFFGSGNLEIYTPLVTALGIDRSQVFFHGHAESISTRFTECEIDLGWSVSMSGSISYAAIELIAMGMPMFFINIGEQPPAGTFSGIKCSESEIETINFHKDFIAKPSMVDDIIAQQQTHVRDSFSTDRLRPEVLKIYEDG